MGGGPKGPSPSFFIGAAVLLAYLPAIEGGPLWDDFGHITAPEFDRSVASGAYGRSWAPRNSTTRSCTRRSRSSTGSGATHLRAATSPTWRFTPTPHFSSCSFCEGSQYRGRCSQADLRAAPHSGRICGVDIGAEEHVIGGVLSGLGVCVSGSGREERWRRSAGLQVGPYWLAFALFLCALFTKTVTATLPAAILLVL